MLGTSASLPDILSWSFLLNPSPKRGQPPPPGLGWPGCGTLEQEVQQLWRNQCGFRGQMREALVHCMCPVLGQIICIDVETPWNVDHLNPAVCLGLEKGQGAE